MFVLYNIRNCCDVVAYCIRDSITRYVLVMTVYVWPINGIYMYVVARLCLSRPSCVLEAIFVLVLCLKYVHYF